MTLLPVSLAVLVAGAVISLLLVRLPRLGLLAAMLAVVVASALALAAGWGVLVGTAAAPVALRWQLPLGAARLTMDGLSAWFVMTISLLAIPVALYSSRYMWDEAGHGSVPMFSAMLCLLVASLLLVVCAGDAVLFLVGWEMMTLSAFFLVSFHNEDSEVRYGAWMYLIATHLGTALFVLPMFAIVASLAASTEFAAFAKPLASASPRMLVLLFLLGLVGFGTKAGFMPMHVWLPNAHPVAPTPVSALLSGVVIKTGIYGILRLLSWLPPLPIAAAIVLLIVATVSGVLGVLYALAQHDLKRLLAYHSVENIGIIGLGIGIGMLAQSTGHPALAAVGYAGALLHVLNHALFKGLLFLSAGAVIHDAGTGDIDRLGGLARRTPVNALFFLIAALAICGLPPLNGFVSEWLIYGSLFRGASSMGGSPAAVSVLALTSLALMGGLALACFAKVFSVVFLGSTRDSSLDIHRTAPPLRLAMAIPAILCILIGVLPMLAIKLTFRGVETLTRLPADSINAALISTLAPARMLTVLACVFAVCVAGLLLLRARGAAAPRGATWGCGYTMPIPRMQYTSSSFAAPLLSSFHNILWPEHEVVLPQGVFPTHSALSTHTPDLAETDVFAPLFSLIGRLARMIQFVSWKGRPSLAPIAVAPQSRQRPLALVTARALSAVRRGTIHMCLTYIVIVLVIVFIIEAIASPRSPAAEPVTAPSASVSGAGGIPL